MPKEEGVLNLHQKLLKIADAAGVLQKTKEGALGHYRYVPEELIQAKVTANMQEFKVMLHTSIVPGTLKVVPYNYNKYDKKIKEIIPVNEVIVSAEMLYTWVNVENPDDKLDVPWALVGQMEDAAQAFGAGATYCNRYFLMKTLQLATSEDDPDAYRAKQIEALGDGIDAKKLSDAIDELVESGKQAIASGVTNQEIKNLISKHNNGNQNARSIKSIEVCEKIQAELSTLKKTEKK
jgi:hypothetical protein